MTHAIITTVTNLHAIMVPKKRASDTGFLILTGNGIAQTLAALVNELRSGNHAVLHGQDDVKSDRYNTTAYVTFNGHWQKDGGTVRGSQTFDIVEYVANDGNTKTLALRFDPKMADVLAPFLTATQVTFSADGNVLTIQGAFA